MLESASKLHDAVKAVVKHRVDLSLPHEERGSLTNYGKRKEFLAVQDLRNALEAVQRESLELPSLAKREPVHEELVNQVLELIPKLEETDAAKLHRTVSSLYELSQKLPRQESFAVKGRLRMPAEVSAEVSADLEELEKCFENGCYRSCVILCGRLLEVALHRKYYEVTGLDILEKNPGIGLGNLVAKLAEKEVKLDPGLTQQIHLINQVRIFSVHKKKESFYPSRDQAQAIILYTNDILRKLF
jgi:hypothetical protein